MLLLRKIIFYVFALIYLILCPLIVARMLGFVISPLTHRLVKTGLVYISTNPPDATVFIDGRLARQKTPTVFRDLPPGEHFIRIELDGYNDWEGDLPVIGRKATVLANTLLIPQEWPIKTISSRPYQNIFAASSDVLIATGPLLKNIDLFHTTQGIEEDFKEENTYAKTPLFSEDSIYADGNLTQLYNAPLSPFILLEASINSKPKFLWINVDEDPPIIEDISDLFPQTPKYIAWQNTDNDNLFAFYPDHIYRISVKDKAIFPQDATNLPQGISNVPAQGPQEKFLINDNNDLLVRERGWIRLYPKGNFGSGPQVYDIDKSMPSTNMYFEEKNGELFYLDNKGDLSAAQILPYHPILNIPIPDALRNDRNDKL